MKIAYRFSVPLYVIASFVFVSCGTLDPEPTQEIPTKLVYPPIFFSLDAAPKNISPGETSTITFVVFTPDKGQNYTWSATVLDPAGGSLDVVSGTSVDHAKVTIHFTSKKTTMVTVAITAGLPMGGGTGKRSNTQCICIRVGQTSMPCRCEEFS